MSRTVRSSICNAMALGVAILVSTGCGGTEESVGEVEQAEKTTRSCTYHDALGGHSGTQTLNNVGGSYVWGACGPEITRKPVPPTGNG